MAIFLQALAFSCGLFSHVLLFSKGEWDRLAPKLISAHVLLCTAIFTAFALLVDHSVTQSFVETFKVSSALLGGLTTSLLTYRVLFHPLGSFPGPLAARISSFWAFREQWPDLRFYTKLGGVHSEYGDFVRISKVRSCRWNVGC